MLTKSREPRRKRPNRQKFGPKNHITSAKTTSRLSKNQEKVRFSREKPAEKIRPAKENPLNRSTLFEEIKNTNNR
jgi:hypothetical protein